MISASLNAVVVHCPICFHAAVKAIAAPAGSSSPADGLKIVEKAKAHHPCTLTVLFMLLCRQSHRQLAAPC
jgi:hypothetical protein